MRTRVLLLAPALLLALATGSSAAPTTVPQVKDAKGDAVGSRPGTDVLSVLWSTAGRGSGKSYVPRQLVVTMTMDAPIPDSPQLTYEVEAMTDTCGVVTLTVAPGTAYEGVTGLNGWADWGSCQSSSGDGSVELATVARKGNAAVWTFSLRSTPLELGTEVTDFVARVDVGNPALPYPSRSSGTALGLVDAARGDTTWVVR